MLFIFLAILFPPVCFLNTSPGMEYARACYVDLNFITFFGACKGILPIIYHTGTDCLAQAPQGLAAAIRADSFRLVGDRLEPYRPVQNGLFFPFLRFYRTPLVPPAHPLPFLPVTPENRLPDFPQFFLLHINADALVSGF
jgi:hypothetical protein